MVENILLQYRGEDQGLVDGKRKHLGKIGLYTSPHLITVRERIRIDGSPISETLFTRYFFELWDRFSDAAAHSTPLHLNPQSTETKPGYFRYLTLLALHAFMEEGVETAIIECGIGGEYDSTNILPADAVTVSAITRLGIDHVGMLGHTIDNIAWHKSGIMKKGVPAFTIEQVPGAMAVLEKRALEVGTEIEVVKCEPHPQLDIMEFKLGLDGAFQKSNARLATAVAVSHLRTLGIASTPRDTDDIPLQFKHGLETAKWEGRCQVLEDGNIQWLIDGAHTTDSIKQAALWFHEKYTAANESLRPPTATMLIFNQQDRDVEDLIRTLITTLDITGKFRLFTAKSLSMLNPNLRVFTYAAFCMNTPFKEDVEQGVDLEKQEIAAKIYSRLDGNSLSMVYSSVEEAVELARRVAEGDERVLVLVTGSLHLVGGLLKVFEREKREIKADDL